MLKELGYLLKYEFRFYFRILPPLYLVLVLVALILRLQGNFTFTQIEGELALEKVISVFILFFIWGAMLFAIFVLTIIHIIQRFINNFMKAQGALMFTLPITIWTLLAAKVIAAFCVVLAGYIAAIVSILTFTQGMGEVISSFAEQARMLSIFKPGEIMIMLFASCATILQFILLIYTAITISYLLPRFRFAAACGIYLAVRYLVEEPVSTFINKNTTFNFLTYLESALDSDMYMNAIHSMISLGFVALAFAAFYFWLTGFLIKRTYNLE